MANKKDREPQIIYRAWCPDYGQTREKAGRWGALGVEAAAVLEAKMNYRPGRDQIRVHVAEPRTDGKTYVYEVIVDVVHRPEFEASPAKCIQREDVI